MIDSLTKKIFIQRWAKIKVRNCPKISRPYHNRNFLTETKPFKVEILFFAKVFIFFFINFFHRDFYISRFRNSWRNRKCINMSWFCCVDQSEKHILSWKILKNSLWTEPLKSTVLRWKPQRNGTQFSTTVCVEGENFEFLKLKPLSFKGSVHSEFLIFAITNCIFLTDLLSKTMTC